MLVLAARRDRCMLVRHAELKAQVHFRVEKTVVGRAVCDDVACRSCARLRLRLRQRSALSNKSPHASLLHALGPGQAS